MPNKSFTPRLFLLLALLLLIIPLVFLSEEGNHQKVKPELKQIDSFLVADSFPGGKGGSVTSAFDNDPETFVYFTTKEKENPFLEFGFQPAVLSKIAFDFGYRRAVDYDLAFYLKEKVVYQEKVRGNEKEIKEHYFPKEGIKTDRIKVTFLKTYDPDRLQAINEIFFFSYQRPKFFEKIIYLKRAFFSYLSYFLLLTFFTFFAGVFITTLFGFRKNETLGFFYSLGIACIILISFIRQVLIRTDFVFLIIPSVVLLTLILMFKKETLIKKIKIHKRNFLLQLVFALLLTTLVCFFDSSPKNGRLDFYFDNTPSYTIPLGFYKQDYLLPYGTAKIFFYRLDQAEINEELLGSYAVSDRTPLVSLYSLPFLYFFGDRFFVFQGIIIFLVSLLMVLTFNYLKKPASKLGGEAIFPLIFIGHYFLFMFHFIPVRLITLFFLINFYQTLFGNQKKSFILLALYSSLAFLTHPVALPYIFLPSLFLLFQKEKRKRLFFLAVPFSLFLFWLWWGKSTGGRLNPFLFSSFQLSGSLAKPIFNLAVHLENRLYNFMGLFINSPHPTIPDVGLGFYRFTLVGALSVSGLMFALLGIIKNAKKLKADFIFLVLIPIFFVVFVSQGIYSRRGLVDNLFPVLFFLLYWGMSVVASWPEKIRKILLSLFVLENGILFFKYDLKPLLIYFPTIDDKTRLLLLLGEIFLCYTLFSFLVLKRKNESH